MKILMWLAKAADPVMAGFSRNPEYHLFFEMLTQKHEFRFAYGADAHLGDGLFLNICRYERGRIVPTEEQFSPDVIYQFSRMDTAGKSFGNAPMLNTPEFKAWGGDKFKQYELLKDFLPKTLEASSREDIQARAQEIDGPVILKPKRGQKGENVIFWDKQTPFDQIPIQEEKLKASGYLVQEFADTSCGIKGVVQGVHDVKLITIGDAVFANLRVPEKPDSYICTFDSDYSEVKLGDLPKEILDFHKGVRDTIYSKFPDQIFTVDLGMTKNGPRLFEINTHTAFPYVHFDYAYEFLETFIAHLEKYSKTAQK